MVSLTLPSTSLSYKAPAIQLNSQQEVIAIEGMSLAPMASASVKAMFETLAARSSNTNAAKEIIDANID
jgi:hypothetical protein